MTKIITKILLLFLIIPQTAHSQDITYDLNVADSLYQQKKFTESFDIYNAILETGEKASPKMLLKMSFIKEGLGDYSSALYYLNLYYLKTSNEKVLSKMKELAIQNGLEGYDYADSDFFMNIYLKHYNKLIYLTLVLVILIGSLLFFQKFKLDKRPVPLGILLVFLLAGAFYLINFGKPADRGIITESSTYIMSGPSAGADVLEIVKKGHRVKIRGIKDVWTEILWDGKTAYIKEKNLKRIRF